MTDENLQQTTKPPITLEKERCELYASLAALEAKFAQLESAFVSQQEKALLAFLKKIKPSYILFVFNIFALVLIIYVFNEYDLYDLIVENGK